MDNLIDEFIKTEEKYVDATNLFIKGSAYWTIASTLGVFSEYLEAPIGARRPNIYVILTSPPAGKRSTLMSHATKIHKNAWKDFVGGEIMEEDMHEYLNSKYFEEFSIEGIIDNINETRGLNKYLDYNLLSSEFGAYVSRTQKSSYLMSSLSFLSKLYYGEPYTQSLSMRGKKSGRRYLPENIYFNLFAGTQKMSEYFDARHIRQGFMRRCIIISVENSDYNRYLDYLSYSRLSLDDALNKFGEKLANRMKYLRGDDLVDSSEKTLIKFDESVMKKINKIDKEIQEMVRRDEDKSYFISQGEILTKLCALTALADLNNEKDSIESIHVTKNHMDYVMPFFSEVIRRTKTVIDEIMLPEDKEKIDPFNRRKARIIRAIIKRDNWNCNITETLGSTWKKEFDILHTLLDEGQIYALYVIKKGRKPLKCFTTDKNELLKRAKEYVKKGSAVIEIRSKDFSSYI